MHRRYSNISKHMLMMVAFNKLVSGLESLKELIRIILFKIKPLVNNYKIFTTAKILE